MMNGLGAPRRDQDLLDGIVGEPGAPLQQAGDLLSQFEHTPIGAVVRPVVRQCLGRRLLDGELRDRKSVV